MCHIFQSLFSPVHLVQLNDAAGAVGSGAAPHAAEAEAAAGPLHHEPSTLKGLQSEALV
jgi:hypothetical protein